MKILLVEDHKMFAESLKNSLEKDNKFSVKILYDIKNHLDEELCRNSYDIVIMDINIKTSTEKYNGLELSKLLLGKYKNFKIVILTGYNLMAYEKEAKAIGCYGFISKDENTEELKSKLNRIFNNEKIFSNNHDVVEEITDAELNIILLYTSGKTRNEVAIECGISVRSLATSLNRIYSKLGVRNYQELVDKSIELGYKKIML